MKALEVLKKYWGFDAFRPLQLEVIESALAHKDTLALLPTGGGKSICFQVPVLCQKGMAIVVSPLIALMQDQVYNLKSKGIRAAAVSSGMSHAEIDQVLENATQGVYKFLYVSPERLQTELFQERLKRMQVCLIAIDEAHCISQWGHDFRPAYRNIISLREQLPNIPVLALTATATPAVARDIQEQLAFAEPHLLQKSFARPNLTYSLVYTEAKWEKCVRALQKSSGSALVYARNRKATAELAQWMRNFGLSADYYHAGLAPDLRAKKLEAWLSGQTRVMACTNAFGMGIDKADVRLVIHMDLPDSIEAYFQEAGRAGRDGEAAHALILLSPDDSAKLRQRHLESFPSEEEVKRIYRCLGAYLQIAIGASPGRQYPFEVSEFAARYNLSPFKALTALKILEREGMLSLTESSYQPSKVQLRLNRTALYDFQLRNPAFDPLIKTLLRSYGGLNVEYTGISEALLAKRLKCSVDHLVKQLKQLRVREVLDYKPRQNTAYLTLLQERLDEENFRISKAHLEDRFADIKRRIEAIIAYAEDRSTCRSVRLLAYFGEGDSEACGKCDVCRKLATEKWSSSKLWEALRNMPSLEDGMAIATLAESLGAEQSEWDSALRILLDEGKLILDRGALRLNK